jgi:hypothetical protein
MVSFLKDSDTAKNGLAICMGLPGLLCLVAPRSVLDFSLTDSAKKNGSINDLTVLLFRCFGSQAMLVGTVLYSSERLGSRGFQGFALAMIPYLAFNVSVVAKAAGAELKMVPNLCDMLNNVVMLAISMAGLQLSKTETSTKAKYSGSDC